ncbi:hypothetical protein QNO07_05165 [Streptomyces sp. 549]|uniref:DUF6584 family protein n=1 Tax=Streptomyces sp. 549 TaxID=3049076 RepID=UPI0024C295E2|nr:DUF6584 family protein [Streptomyces sp. 549]MDK1472824.1 hypothetical protein [Streptomyces sp. 549]
MARTETLARVDADLAAGRTPLARQRLRGLVSSYPQDLTLRRRLAEVYRLHGEAAEAGRWMYLCEDRDEEETARFEARYHHPRRRMKALAWRGQESDAGSAFAAEQLASVRAACSAALGRPVYWGDELGDDDDDEEGGGSGTDVSDRLAGIGCFLAVGASFALWMLGLVTLLGMLF